MLQKDLEKEEAEEKAKEMMERTKPLYQPGHYPMLSALADRYYLAYTWCCNTCMCRCCKKFVCGACVKWCAKESRYMSMSPRMVHGFSVIGLVVVLLSILTAGVGCT